MRKLYCLVNNLNVGGITYHKGDIGHFPDNKVTDQLINSGTLSTNPPMPKVDKQPIIVENKSKSSKVKESKSNGSRSKSKSRRVRSAGETVPEGLCGTESPD